MRPHFLERGVRKYIVSDEKAVSFVGSGDELLQISKQIGRYAMDNSPRILYTKMTKINIIRKYDKN